MSNPITPSELLAFQEAMRGKKGDFDSWLECNNEAEVISYINAHAAAVSAADNAALRAKNAKLKTVMVAAAEEIHAHWDAHCDAEGYGPANLMRRLEEGIPSQYGYTAGAFEQLRERVRVLEDALRLALAELDELPAWSNAGYVCNIARAALEKAP